MQEVVTREDPFVLHRRVASQSSQNSFQKLKVQKEITEALMQRLVRQGHGTSHSLSID